ncbi:hypothetical protein [Pedobacter mucosus]|uniref:hypothetical protein n=1 Tax=Pedobacter mucosus TaxID=2895286 RepID=UPI001EE40C8D|nr:hypothetical protein [Pedobacter mucosus]UKT65702.1 hypothetical protein LOK61_07895 [Pedobacter mucosus]
MYMKGQLVTLKRSSVNILQLNKIKVGDFISDEFGKSGMVMDIEVVNYYRETQFYFSLDKAGTILFIV